MRARLVQELPCSESIPVKLPAPFCGSQYAPHPACSLMRLICTPGPISRCMCSPFPVARGGGTGIGLQDPGLILLGGPGFDHSIAASASCSIDPADIAHRLQEHPRGVSRPAIPPSTRSRPVPTQHAPESTALYRTCSTTTGAGATAPHNAVSDHRRALLPHPARAWQ